MIYQWIEHDDEAILNDGFVMAADGNDALVKATREAHDLSHEGTKIVVRPF